MTNFQLFMPSPNLLQTQIPYMVAEKGGGASRSTFDAEPKSAKT